MEPITEQRQVPGPVVYGYLLLMAACRARRAALSRAPELVRLQPMCGRISGRETHGARPCRMPRGRRRGRELFLPDLARTR
jgi:hypothetical protein